jgi:CubicO group peptidase (beta-lactamase class C family)
MLGAEPDRELLDRVTVTLPDETFPRAGRPVTAREACSWTNVQGIIVVRNGHVIAEEYMGMDPAQRHHWMSISKSAVHMLLGMLVTRGDLDLSRTVDHYLPELGGCGYGCFTLQELADMNAHVSMNEEDYSNPNAAFWDWGRAIGWFGDGGQWPGGVKQLIKQIDRLPPRRGDDAQDVYYTGSNSQVLVWIIERITGMSTRDCYERLLWQHVGAVMDAAVSVDVHGVVFAGGGWLSTLRDLARYGSIWTNRGVAPDGTRIFEPEWTEESFRGTMCVYKDWRYHNHCYTRGQGMVHQGHSGQMLWTNPTTGTLVACFGSVLHPNGQEQWTARLQLFMAEQIDRYLVEQAAAIPRGRDS